MESKKIKNCRGYTIIEVFLFLGLLIGMIAYTLPEIKTLKEEERVRKVQQLTSRLETAKNMFDDTSSPATRAKFDGSSDESRYEQLSILLGQPDPLLFVSGSGVTRMFINRLSEDVVLE
jgi:type II secretory pathway pseudopilin PulG